MLVYEYEILSTCFISNYLSASCLSLAVCLSLILLLSQPERHIPKPETFTNQPQVKLGNTLYLSSIKHGTLRLLLLCCIYNVVWIKQLFIILHLLPKHRLFFLGLDIRRGLASLWFGAQAQAGLPVTQRSFVLLLPYVSGLAAFLLFMSSNLSFYA